MRKLLFFSLPLLLSFACVGEKSYPPFVTDAVISPADELFAPGDEVIVTATGFEPDDDILFRIAWSAETSESTPAGVANGVWGVVTARTASTITFLAPGGYPASKVCVQLFRQGRAMTLGQIKVSNGMPPAEYSLYGIGESEIGLTEIERIDMLTGEAVPVQTLDAGQRLDCAVNLPGTNTIYGVSPGKDNGMAVGYDLTMKHYRESGADRTVTNCVFGVAGPLVYFVSDDGLLWLHPLKTTRESPLSRPRWSFPENITPEMFSEYPAVYVDSYFSLSLRVGDGVWQPALFVLTAQQEEAVVGAEIEADRVFPVQSWGEQTQTGPPVRRCCYAVAKDGKTRLVVFDGGNLDLYETLAEIPGTAISAAALFDNDGKAKLYLLCDDGDARRIRVYDHKTGQITTLPGQVYCSQIVLAR